MRREWECAPPVIHKSSEHATGYFMGILWANEWHKRRKGIACKPMDALIDEAVVRAHAAMAEQTRTREAVPDEQMRGMANPEGDEYAETCDGEMAGSGAGDVQPVSGRAVCGEGQDGEGYQGMEGDFDRLIRDLECGEGAGR